MNNNTNSSDQSAQPSNDLPDASTDTEDGVSIGYAEAVAELDDILLELDSDDVDIDVLSALVERAAQLISICRSRISVAQSRVEKIVDELESPE